MRVVRALMFGAMTALAAVPASADEVDALIAKMTLEEKAAQLQDSAPAIPRLGLPAYTYWNEALHGVARAGEATVFPQAIGMAATWDKSLLRAEGQTIGIEGRAKYNQAQKEGRTGRYFGLNFWSPNINIFRDPRWGRGQETLGEDPYLTGVLATEFIRGVQGNDPKYLTAAATAKHLAVHSGPEQDRHHFNVNPSRQDLTETYLPAFRRTIIDGKVEIVMCAYNAVDGKPACGSEELVNQALRKDWKFAGHVTSDCGAIDDITTGHKFTKTNVEAVAVAVKAGTEMNCGFKNEYLDLPKAVAAGLITESEIDVALKRVLGTRAKLGILPAGTITPWSDTPYSANHSAAHVDVALRAARESIVLLKNDGILPLKAAPARIAVVGPGATSLISLEGNYNGTPTAAVLPLDGLKQAYPSSNISYAQGSAFVEGASVHVPRTAFADGVTAQFFNNTTFEGPVVATRRYDELDHNWNWIAPAEGVNPRDFSVRWTASLKLPAAGDYRFELQRRRCDATSDVERYVITIEGAEPLKVETPCSARDAGESPAVVIHAADTKPRKLVVEYAHRSKDYAPVVTLAWQAPSQALLDQALAVAKPADVILAFVGLNAWLEGEEMPVAVPGFSGGDRTDIGLPATQRRMLQALQATGKPVVVVLQTGSAVSLGDDGQKTRAILNAWYGGEQGGKAIADVISGKYNPAGRLPVTFYTAGEKLPDFADYSMRGRTYRYFSGTPEYPFGYGLSFTRFGYSDAKVEAPAVAAGAKQRVTIKVRNDGKVAGDEVVQLYISPERRDAPLRSLKGFERIHLAPGEERTVAFDLVPRDLAFADANGVMRIVPGTYKVWVGGGQPGTVAPGQATAFQVTGELTLDP
ncbi:glycoside hydrolase family 3 C-terminal domain-containing protein [Sphingomonas daechungensis]|uniref:glycoside hydrolase family 3 C-terminal domain-containing protein n=1 Tax=Sphingomonas daechungensis TaxID=1176646 RepID=UPI003783895C